MAIKYKRKKKKEEEENWRACNNIHKIEGELVGVDDPFFFGVCRERPAE